MYLDDEYCEFLKRNFPHYNERMVTIPVSFQYKDVKTHGIVCDNGRRKGGEKSKEEKYWIGAVSRLRAKQRIFYEIQRQFSDKPCLLINGFSEHDLIKVVKSKLHKYENGIQLSDKVTRTGVDKVKPKVWFRYTLWIGIFIMVRKGRLTTFSLNTLDYPLSFLSLSTWTWNTFPILRGTWAFCLKYSRPDPLKVIGWWSQVLVLRHMVWSQGLTIEVFLSKVLIILIR